MLVFCFWIFLDILKYCSIDSLPPSPASMSKLPSRAEKYEISKKYILYLSFFELFQDCLRLFGVLNPKLSPPASMSKFPSRGKTMKKASVLICYLFIFEWFQDCLRLFGIRGPKWSPPASMSKFPSRGKI